MTTASLPRSMTRRACARSVTSRNHPRPAPAATARRRSPEPAQAPDRERDRRRLVAGVRPAAARSGTAGRPPRSAPRPAAAPPSTRAAARPSSLLVGVGVVTSASRQKVGQPCVSWVPNGMPSRRRLPVTSRLPSVPWSRASPPRARAIPKRWNAVPWMTRPPARMSAVMCRCVSMNPRTRFASRRGDRPVAPTSASGKRAQPRARRRANRDRDPAARPAR